MQKCLLLLLATFLSINCYSQISFEKGYYIDNFDKKINCYIKNIDWRNNPTKFEYKLSQNTETKSETIKSVKEFGVDNFSKYIRATVNIDRSSDITNKLGYDKDPIFNKEELFLKVLIEGNSNLYEFIDGSLRRFFYSKINTEIKQLIYKRYKLQEKSIGYNNTFRQQLLRDLKCSNISLSQINSISYEKKELVKFFSDYNDCHNYDYINYAKIQKKDFFNLSIRPGFNRSNLHIDNRFFSEDGISLDNEFTIRFGIEAEFILPFNKNKWAIIIEPTYQYYSTEKELPSIKVNANYQSVELPIGIRYYFFLKENAKLFMNSSFITDLSFNSSLEFNPGSYFPAKTQNNLAFGAGYKHNNKYSIELRYLTNRVIESDLAFWSSKYNTISVIFGYSIF